MGRKRIYETKKEKHEADLKRMMNYYWTHCDKMRKQSLKNYYKRKKLKLEVTKTT